jgi:hypothetical protein
MTQQQFEELIRTYHANPKTCRYDWDGYKCTYFSIDHGNNQIIGIDDGLARWEMIFSVDKTSCSMFVKSSKVIENVTAALKKWDTQKDTS